MILATKSGWLIATKLIRETPTFYILKHRDSNNESKVRKDSKTHKLFDNVDDALDWIDE